MIRTVKAIINSDGTVRLLEQVEVEQPHMTLVTILDNGAGWLADETALLSEPALARDWNRPEEDAAWSHLQRRTSS